MPEPKTKHKSRKGKQHPVHAISLARIAASIDKLIFVTPSTLAKVFMDEANRVQKILR